MAVDPDTDLELKILRAALKRVLRSRDFNVNPHYLGHSAEKLAAEVGTDRATVLTLMKPIYLEVLESGFEAAKTAQGGGGH